MEHPTTNQSGVIMILSLIIIAAVLSFIAVQATLTGLTHLEKAQTLLEAKQVLAQAEDCSQEALLQLRADEDYGGGEFSLGAGECLVTVADDNGNKEVLVIAESGERTHQITILVQENPFAVLIWDR